MKRNSDKHFVGKHDPRLFGYSGKGLFLAVRHVGMQMKSIRIPRNLVCTSASNHCFAKSLIRKEIY